MSAKAWESAAAAMGRASNGVTFLPVRLEQGVDIVCRVPDSATRPVLRVRHGRAGAGVEVAWQLSGPDRVDADGRPRQALDDFRAAADAVAELVRCHPWLPGLPGRRRMLA